jgi:hypothetical protein
MSQSEVMAVEFGLSTTASSVWRLGVPSTLVVLQRVEPVASGNATFPSMKNKLGLTSVHADLESFSSILSALEAGEGGFFLDLLVGEVDGGASLLRQPIPALWQLTAIVLSMARLVGVRHRRHFRR